PPPLRILAVHHPPRRHGTSQRGPLQAQPRPHQSHRLARAAPPERSRHVKTLRIVTLAAALLAPNAHAQGGVETMFDEALEALCSAQGALTSVPMGEMAIEIPGISAFGVDIRPLCQYADIVGKGTKTLKDLRNGTFRVTEDFINNTLAAVANTIGARV